MICLRMNEFEPMSSQIEKLKYASWRRVCMLRESEPIKSPRSVGHVSEKILLRGNFEILLPIR